MRHNLPWIRLAMIILIIGYVAGISPLSFIIIPCLMLMIGLMIANLIKALEKENAAKYI